MAAAPNSLNGVTILAPSVGGAPRPPSEARDALRLIMVYQEAPRRTADQLSTEWGNLTRFVQALCSARAYRHQAHGLTAAETAKWAMEVGRRWPVDITSPLLEYARTCHSWLRQLDAVIGTHRADPDWDMTSARNVAPSAPEAYLAQTLAAAGIPVQAQVGMAKESGGARRGGWFGSFWLDCAHRDPQFLLRIDIELDGRHHDSVEQQQRDRRRNLVLRERGWYVVRLSGRILGREEHQRAVRTIAALAKRHRQAVVLGRSHLPTLERLWASPRGGTIRFTLTADWEPSLPARHLCADADGGSAYHG